MIVEPYGRILVLLAMAAAPAVRAQEPPPAPDSRPGIAVLAFENGGSYGRPGEDYDALRRGIAGILIGELSQNTTIRLVDRGETQRILEEQSLGTTGRVDAGTAAKVGKLVGARYMVTGTFIDLYGEFRLDARVIDVETGEILKVVRSDPQLRDLKELYRVIQSLAADILSGTRLPSLPVVAAAPTRPREVPTEALNLYSRALLYEDRGEIAKAIEYYQKALEVFPDFTEAKEGLRKALGSGG